MLPLKIKPEALSVLTKTLDTFSEEMSIGLRENIQYLSGVALERCHMCDISPMNSTFQYTRLYLRIISLKILTHINGP